MSLAEFEQLLEEAKKLAPNDAHDLNVLSHLYWYWCGAYEAKHPNSTVPKSLQTDSIKEQNARKSLRAYIARIKDGQNVRIRQIEKEFGL